MDDLLIGVYPESESVLAGESLPVRVLIANESAEAVSLAGGLNPSPFQYRLLSRKDGAQRYAVSNRHLEALLTNEPNQPFEPPPAVVLDAKRQISLNEDLAASIQEPFSPDQYSVVASYVHNGVVLTSQPSDIDVTVPHVENLSAQICNPRRERSTLMSCRDRFGGVVLLERQSAHGDPRFGMFRRRRTFEGVAGLQDIATSVDTVSITGGRWIAWLEGGWLGSMKCWEDSVMAEVDPVHVDLDNPRFVQPGFQLADGTCLFLVVGTTEGETRLAPFVVSAAGWRKFPQSKLGEGFIRSVAARYVPEIEGGGLQLVWAGGEAAAPEIWTRSFGIAGHPSARETRMLADLKAPLLAWDTQPLGLSRTAAVQILSGSEAHLTSLRLPLEKDIEQYSRELTPLEQPVEAWVIAAAESSRGAVLAKSGDQLLWTQARDAGPWQVFTNGALAVQHFRLFTMEGGFFWVEWIDPRYGHLIRPLSGIFVPM